MVFALHSTAAVRSIAIVTAVVIMAAWAMLRYPSGSAADSPAVERPAGHLQEIRSIALDGHNSLSPQLRELLETRVGAPLDRDRLDRDRRAMERALDDLGYLAARVEPATVAFDAAGAAYVSFEIEQGPVFHVRSVRVTGPGKDAVVITLAAGDDAIRSRIELARQALADGLGRRGRPAKVALSVRTDLAEAAVDVILATT